MADITRSLSSAVTIQYYKFGASLSSNSFQISHNISDISYDAETLNVTAAVPISLISFIKSFGIIFMDSFQTNLGSATTSPIPGWSKSVSTGGTVNREDTEKFSRIKFVTAAAGDYAYISRRIPIPRKLRTAVGASYFTQNYVIYFFANEVGSGTGGNVKFRVVKESTFLDGPPTIIQDWTAISGDPISTGIMESTSLSGSSDFFIRLDVGIPSSVSTRYVNSIALVTMPSEMTTPDSNDMPFIRRESNDDASKEGFIVSFSTSDGTTELNYVFRGCSMSCVEKLGTADDVMASISFRYKSLSIGEDW